MKIINIIIYYMSISFILFLDPQSRSFYSYSYDIGIIVKENPPEKIKNKMLKQFDDLQLLTDVKTWSKLNDFQRRPVPKYFLKQRKYRYPVYITQQHFPQVLCDVIQVKKVGDKTTVETKFSDKIQLVINLQSLQAQLQGHIKQGKTLEAIKPQAKLLLSANEIIRIVSRMILQKYNVIIVTTKQSSKFILKVGGSQQYIYGNEPLMNFQIVRECLRNQQQLKLEMIEANIDPDQQFKRFIFQRREQDIKKHIYEPFPWQNLQENMKASSNQDFLLWHRPDLHFLTIDQQVILQQKNADLNNKRQQLQKQKFQINKKIQRKKQILKNKILRYLWKQQMNEFMEFRTKEIQNSEVQLKNTFIYTGECCYAYSFDIVGIANMFNILEDKHHANYQKKSTKKFFLNFPANGKEINENFMPKQLTCAYQRNKWLGKRVQGRQPYLFSISTEFYFNGKPFFSMPETKPLILSKSPIFKQTVIWDSLARLMMQTSIVFKITIYSHLGDGEVLGAGVIKIFDEYGFLKQGEHYVQIFSIDFFNQKKIGCMDKIITQSANMTTLKIMLPIFKCPVRWSLCSQICLKNLGYLPLKAKIQKIEEKPELKKLPNIQEVLNIINYDPLRLLIDHKMHPQKKEETELFRQILRNNTNQYRHLSDKLKHYLYSVDWHDVDQINEAYKELEKWASLTPLDGLLLLTPEISDEKVRLHAIRALQQMPDHEILLYSNQITQALVSFETHLNPLIDFIIQKSVESPFTIGHEYFWQFKNKTTDFITYYRFTIYVEVLMMCCPIRYKFVQQVQVNKILIKQNMKFVQVVGQMKKHEERQRPFEQMIPTVIAKQLKAKDSFIFPVRPKAALNHIYIQKCKLFNSKKFPFMLVCDHKKQYQRFQLPKYKVMFKYNDDIKQDHLILRMFKVFNNFWLQEGLDFKMIIYEVLSTGNNVGFIQIVDNCASWHSVHEKDTNKSLLSRKTSTYKYLKSYNNDQTNYRIARENFFLSCAGYLVAAYVLGIADRHSGNILIKENGKMFHIDFGNILGNFKKFGPYERQSQSFVLTQEFAFIIGEKDSDEFRRFENLCAKAFNVLRKHGNTIINLLMMMVPAQLPQLKAYKNIEFVRDKLNLMESDSQAADRIKADIKKALESLSRQFDNMIHEGARTN